MKFSLIYWRIRGLSGSHVRAYSKPTARNSRRLTLSISQTQTYTLHP